MEWRCALDISLIIFFSLVLLCSLFFFTWNAIKVYRQWVPCGPNSSYSFPSIVLKLCKCFQHGMKMCMWFGYNIDYFFSLFLLCELNFLHEMLSKCIDSGYLLLVFHWLFWNFADVFCMKWRCACGSGIIYSEAIKSIQFLVLNTGSYVNGCVKMFILSFCQTSSSAKHKLELFCHH